MIIFCIVVCMCPLRMYVEKKAYFYWSLFASTSAHLPFIRTLFINSKYISLSIYVCVYVRNGLYCLPEKKSRISMNCTDITQQTGFPYDKMCSVAMQYLHLLVLCDCEQQKFPFFFVFFPFFFCFALFTCSLSSPNICNTHRISK